MKTHFLSALILLFAASTASADVITTWNFDDTANPLKKTVVGDTGTVWDSLLDGTTKTNPSTDSADKYIKYVQDSYLGSQVVQFTQSNLTGAVISLGNLPAIAGKTSSIGADFTVADMTISFWAKTDNAAGNRTMIGNRNPEQNGYNFMKIDGGALQYFTGNINLATAQLISADNAWHYYAIAKADNKVTVYRDGKTISSLSDPGNLKSTFFGLGGDVYSVSELWSGSFDSVSISSVGQTAEQVKSGYLSRFQEIKKNHTQQQVAASNNVRPMSFLISPTETEQAIAKGSTWTSGNGTKWNVLSKGLESTRNVDINASINASGQLVIAGTASAGTAWNGVTLQTDEKYTASADNIVVFSMDRISLSQSGDAARASMWMYNSDNNYIHFSQNTEAGNKYTYNNTNKSNARTGGGFYTSVTADSTKPETMTLKHDGSQVWMYADGQLIGVTDASFTEFSLMISGMSRSYNSGTNTMSAVLDSPMVTILKPSTWQTPTIDVTHDFASAAATAADWQYSNGNVSVLESLTTSNVTETHNVGMLQIKSSGDLNGGEAVLKEFYALNNPASIRVERESMGYGSNNASGLALKGNEGTQLSVYQDGLGYWTIAWDNMGVENLKSISGETSTDIAIGAGAESVQLYAGDFYTTQLLLDSSVLDADSKLFDLYLNDRHFQFEAMNMDDIFQASLFSLGNGTAVFNDFGIKANDVPEPATALMLLLGSAGIALWRKRRV